MINDERLISILCAQQWEKCKGELNAMVALQGSRLTQYDGNKVVVDVQWRKLQTLVDDFTHQVEFNGLHE